MTGLATCTGVIIIACNVVFFIRPISFAHIWLAHMAFAVCVIFIIAEPGDKTCIVHESVGTGSIAITNVISARFSVIATGFIVNTCAGT